MPMRLLRLAIVALIIPLSTACQTTTSGSSTDVREAIAVVDTTAADVKREVCRGQEPEGIDPAVYDSLPKAAQTYITNNVDQWLKGCGERG